MEEGAAVREQEPGGEVGIEAEAPERRRPGSVPPTLAIGSAVLWLVTATLVLLLAGLRSLPSEPVEAASIDGASVWQVFWHVTLTLLRPYILVALLLPATPDTHMASYRRFALGGRAV